MKAKLCILFLIMTLPCLAERDEPHERKYKGASYTFEQLFEKSEWQPFGDMINFFTNNGYAAPKKKIGTPTGNIEYTATINSLELGAEVAKDSLLSANMVVTFSGIGTCKIELTMPEGSGSCTVVSDKNVDTSLSLKSSINRRRMETETSNSSEIEFKKNRNELKFDFKQEKSTNPTPAIAYQLFGILEKSEQTVEIHNSVSFNEITDGAGWLWEELKSNPDPDNPFLNRNQDR